MNMMCPPMSAVEALDRVKRLRIKLTRIDSEKKGLLTPIREMKANAIPINHMELFDWISELEALEKYLLFNT